mmetsp:Transcript_29390/g.45055  ORF Transcript_29390/g.45055 Transcript_29390/m.45055 type:complete len:473 (-) Transcript_29390:955-2373(-)|eukprot:CAMPEP_0118687858 /NCGR_PEP_ID=MMETSP0800-20121206/8610_1 /TAXON_ID=210618 ORGANISM="Striatella unipunctata, Strain CCMP2910" /NCGR_SAMPLE_ID=MMETSP0800 /ASSEMBLY_ACC=CAM_ASM_000638 /LENGTH=472 /DNA_ID=CAMNT_0006585077 /DNA_START=270 /DNA_END=1688 /DNA_ORIENTATION=+
MIPVSIPRFAPASGGENIILTAPTTWTQLTDGDLDVDMLAEYLLDDGTASSAPNSGLMFDFSMDPNALNSGVVSPEQSEAEGASGESSNGQHSGQGVGARSASSTNMEQLQQALAARSTALEKQQAAVSSTVVQAPPTKIAAPLGAQVVQVVHQPAGATVFHMPGQIPLAPTLLSGGTQQMPADAHMLIAQQANSRHKRPRIDQPLIASTTGTLVTVDGQNIFPGQISRGGRQKSQAQVDRRRERNRILARRTRLRKKFFFESLQKEVIDLQKENMVLKDMVKTKLPSEKSKSILEECKAGDKLPSVVSDVCGEETELDQRDFSLMQSIQSSQKCFVITDPSLQDNPIVYASEDFLSLTGYARDDVLGRNCRFLQGTETSTTKVEEMRKGLAAGEDVSVCLINYKADGTAFWNKLFIAALRDAQNNIVNFIGVIVKVASPDEGDSEAGKTLPGESTPENAGNTTETDDGGAP